MDKGDITEFRKYRFVAVVHAKEYAVHYDQVWDRAFTPPQLAGRIRFMQAESIAEAEPALTVIFDGNGIGRVLGDVINSNLTLPSFLNRTALELILAVQKCLPLVDRQVRPTDHFSPGCACLPSDVPSELVYRN